MKLSDYVWDRVADAGVRHVFMFPGGGAMHLVDSLGRSERLKHVTLLHEQACSFAAETYARISEGIGAVCVTSGPGATNAVTGCAAAWLESTPVLFVSGQAKTADLKGDSGVRQKGNQEIGIVDIVSSITKHAATVTDPRTIAYHVDKALHEASSGRPGPVWLDIPLDVQAAEIEPAALERFEPQERAEPSDGLDEVARAVADALAHARRPVVIGGQGIERGGGRATFRRLVERAGAPALTSWIATELLASGHPLNMGKPGMVAPRYSNFALQASDLVIALGTRLDPAMAGYDPAGFAPHAKKVVVDVDGAELRKFGFEVDIAVETDAAEFARRLLDVLEEEPVPDFGPWIEQCASWRERYPLEAEYAGEEAEEGRVHPIRFMGALSDALADDDVVIPGSSGAGIDLFWLAIRNKERQRMLATGSLGSMGYGLPAAIGACLASGRRTVCVEGDGSLQLNVQELASVAGMGLPLKMFIFDNGGYLSIMNMQKNHFDGRFVGANEGSGLHVADIDAVARAYGIRVVDCDPARLEASIAKVLEGDGPALCRVPMSSETAVKPKVASRAMPDGSMASGRLEDLWPFLPADELERELRGAEGDVR